MTQEEKQLLLTDICSRLPYGVIVKDRNGIHQLTVGNTEFIDLFSGKCNIKPYLRPMSSMTDDEVSEFNKIKERNGYVPDKSETYLLIPEYVDWLIANHFDFRGLIPKGLALETTEGMYQIL